MRIVLRPPFLPQKKEEKEGKDWREGKSDRCALFQVKKCFLLSASFQLTFSLLFLLVLLFHAPRESISFQRNARSKTAMTISAGKPS